MSARRFCTTAVLFALFTTCWFATAAQADVFTDPIAPAANTQGAPTVASDKSDYQPGDSVVLSGGNWQPGESVHIVVNDDGLNPEQPWRYESTIVADEQGGLSDTFQLPTWFVASYTVSATGDSGASAQTTFTDGNLTFARATDSATVPGAWSVSYESHKKTSNCTSTGNDLSSGLSASVPNGGTGSIGIGTPDSVKITGVTPPSGYTFAFWSTTAGGSATSQRCVDGNGGSLFAHFTPSVQTTSLVASTASGTFGGTTTLSATLTAGSPASGVSGKTISFSLNGTSVGTAVTNASGVATLTGANLTGINAGTYPTGISASFAGDSSYASSSASAQLTVAKATPSINVDWADTTYDGNPHPASASVSGVGGANIGPADSLTYYSGSTATGSALTGAPTNAGTYTVRAHVNATTNYLAADLDKTITIAKATQTITFAALTNKTYGAPAFTVSGTGGPSGNPVTFSVGASDNCTTGGTNGATITITGAGSCTVTASQAGDGNYLAAASVPRTFSIAKATPSINVNWADTTYDGNTHPATASVSGVGAANLGAADSLTYYSGATATGTALGGAPTNAGTYTVRAHVNATTNYLAADQDRTLTIAKATATLHLSWAPGPYDGHPQPASASTSGVGGDALGDPTLTYYR
ncbi:MAG TPA: Ig-like domain repeat protein, partial [Thermoleophilaceae bacterium]|nr:Ig-like domain repeat protein [Thermoleophilaceae bacterium]